jgi:hypothetical protein
MKQILQSIFILFGSVLSAQSFTNGSFEATSAPMSCFYNLGNADFNSFMSNVIAYGPGEEVDIIINGCYNPAIPHGLRAVGLANFPSDEIAIPVTPSLVAGQSYSFTFRAYAELTFRTRGDIQIGASTNTFSFGTLIFTGATIGSTWRQFTVNFTAPVNATHITVRNIPDGIIHWNHVDDFRFITLLPVNIQSFEAYKVDKNAKLEWITQSEENNDYFTIERSVDCIEWQKIGKVQGAGNSNYIRQYEYTDHYPYEGVNYYRLIQTDFDGNSTYSEIKAVEFEKSDENNGIIIYPNPFEDVLQIQFQQNQQILSLSIFDAQGRIVYNNQSDTRLIDLKILPTGFYLIEIELTSGEKIVRKLIKNR